MTEQKRRRIDQVLSDEFCRNVEDLSLEELRRRRDLAEEVERELSYYRRLFHGRMDLLAFEMRRRSGEESRTLIEALPEILASGIPTGGEMGELRHVSVELELPEVTGRRDIDQILEGDAITRVTTMGTDELADLQLALAEAERAVSAQRRSLHEVIDRLQAEIIDRYKRGLAGSDVRS